MLTIFQVFTQRENICHCRGPHVRVHVCDGHLVWFYKSLGMLKFVVSSNDGYVHRVTQGKNQKARDMQGRREYRP